MMKIAITGGPSGGKTTLIDTIKRELPKEVAVVPEAASILYKGGFPRFAEPESVRSAQTAIYFTQMQLENLMQNRHPQQALICDRGSLDGVAYWPSGSPSFFERIESLEASEISRYQWVIHLDTAPEPTYDTTNSVRTETFREAQILNQKIHQAWSRHPQRLIIPQYDDFLKKLTMSLNTIRAILSGRTPEEIKSGILALK